MSREILGDSNNCKVNEIKCAHLRGNNWCELLRANVAPVEKVSAGIQKCPGFFLSLDQLRRMDFKTMIPMLADSPMTRLNTEAVEREAQRPQVQVEDFGPSPNYDRLTQ